LTSSFHAITILLLLIGDVLMNLRSETREALLELNSRQREAVQVVQGPALVLAGPGSGKTRVLTHRVGYLVRECGVAPWRLMAVTFTNKAAREMKERLTSVTAVDEQDELLGSRQLQAMSLGTFHSICARILRREVEALSGWDRNFVIYDAGDQLTLLRQALRDLNLDDKRYRPAVIHNIISHAKNELVNPDTFHARTYTEEIAARVYHRYQGLLRDNNAMDFDDLLMKTVELFQRRDDLLGAYQERYLHVLVDEFQDTNMAQYELVKLLAGKHRNLFIVADEDQSIYSWRGADYRNVLRFRDDFPEHHLVLLEQNYRSTPTILEAAKHIIRKNPHRVDKNLFSQRDSGVKVEVFEAYDEQDEARFVVGEIARLEAEAKIPPSHCAVMYRTNAQSRVLEEEFVRRGMKYRLVRGTRFYERREVKDAIAYLRLIHNPHDSVSMARIINTPTRGIGGKTVASLESWAFKLETSIFDALLQLQAEADGKGPPLPSPFAARARRALLRFADLLTTLTAARDDLTLPELFDLTLARSGYRDFVRDGTREGEDRWENLLELRGVTQEYASVDASEALFRFLEEVALISDVDGLTDDERGPALLTLHAAKGLEFRVVFIVGLDEGLLPHSRSLDDVEAMEEERRLCYVGVTRAMDRLYLLHTFRRTIHGMNELSSPSRFLADLPGDLIAGQPALPGGKKTRLSPIASGSVTSTGSRIGVGWSSDTTGVGSDPAHVARFRVGDTVIHTQFGEGVVIKSDITDDDQEVEVAFPDQGIKRLSVSFAPMEKKG
jgi:DNA helicase-2/ATP-dependent DNA helicase PcrA